MVPYKVVPKFNCHQKFRRRIQSIHNLQILLCCLILLPTLILVRTLSCINFNQTNFKSILLCQTKFAKKIIKSIGIDKNCPPANGFIFGPHSFQLVIAESSTKYAERKGEVLKFCYKSSFLEVELPYKSMIYTPTLSFIKI